ncbi:MAG: hypothetical protein AB3N10_17105, partial [Allomuricauda sp.]
CSLFLIVGLWSCSSDDPNTVPNVPQPTTTELQEETVSTLTNKVWKIESAKLTNGNEVLDISDNFNIEDDEFIFSGGTIGSLEWRRGHDVYVGATSVDQSMLDYYRSPKASSYSFVGESTSDLTTDDLDIAVSENGTVTVTFSNSGTSKIQAKTAKGISGNLTLTLVKKNPDDHKSPVDGLNFSEVFTFESDAVEGYSPGMIGSYSDNSFFFVNREDVLEMNGKRPERVIKFDLDNDTQKEYVNYDSEEDAVSKQLHIVNNKLIAFGASFVNTYDLDISTSPSSVAHDIVSTEFNKPIGFTRFGIAVQDDAVYIIGGAFIPEGPVFEIDEAKNI